MNGDIGDIQILAQYMQQLYNAFQLNEQFLLSSSQPTGSFNSTTGGLEPFPIGAVFIAVVDTDPADLLGYGTWEAFGTGRTLVGVDTGQTEFDEVEKEGGEKEHQLTTAEMPSHTHVQDAHHHTQQVVSSAVDGVLGSRGANAANDTAVGVTSDATAVNQNAGGDGSHNNLQPYITVYLWKRTA